MRPNAVIAKMIRGSKLTDQKPTAQPGVVGWVIPNKWRCSEKSESSVGIVFRRRGYTLVEMLIASVLVAALMSVVWGMMSMYNGYLTAGQTQATQQQLIRSLLQQLENDLQSVSTPDTNPQVVPSLDLSSSISDLSAETFSARADQMSPALVFNQNAPNQNEPSVFAGLQSAETLAIPGQVSLVGNSSSMKLSIEKPHPAFLSALRQNSMASDSSLQIDDANMPPATAAADSFALPEDSLSAEGIITAEGVAPKVSEYQTIIWQFQSPGMIGGNQALQAGLYRIETESLLLQSALNRQDSLLEDSAAESDAAVDRTTLETLLFPSVTTETESGGVASNADVTVQDTPKFDLIPEVVSCRFQYFSGSSWTSTWNSEQQKSLPLAIRTRMQFVTTADLEKLKLIFGDSTTTNSPLDQAINNRPSSTSAGDPGPNDSSQSLTTADSAADPLAAIRTRQIERIILLQPVTGPMPELGIGSDAFESEAAL